MPSRYRPELPEPLAITDLRIEDEEHRYKVFDNQDGSVYEEREYTLDKAPVKRVEKIIGVSDGETTEFVEGTDYELSSDGERIVWQTGNVDRPDRDSIFKVTYICDSILSRYVDAGVEEMDEVEKKLTDVISHKFIDTAEGDELDELGKLFGVLGQRRERDDFQYRVYLKSVVQSFISRGTVNGIKVAVSAATDVPIKDIEVREDFQENAYEVVVIPDTAVRGSVIEQIAEIADPSGVKQIRTRFTIDEDVVGFDDSVAVVGPVATVDDQMASDDAVTIDGNKVTTAEDVGSTDAVTTTETAVATYDSSDWDNTNWTTEVN